MSAIDNLALGNKSNFKNRFYLSHSDDFNLAWQVIQADADISNGAVANFILVRPQLPSQLLG